MLRKVSLKALPIAYSQVWVMHCTSGDTRIKMYSWNKAGGIGNLILFPGNHRIDNSAVARFEKIHL